MTVMDRRALVLGGGGVTGIAWETGLIAGLAGLDIDLAAADVIIGTSAGSVVGADIASGQEFEALYQAQLAPPAPEPPARIGWDFIGRLLWDVHTSRDPKRARARIGTWALAVPSMPTSATKPSTALGTTPSGRSAGSSVICPTTTNAHTSHRSHFLTGLLPQRRSADY